MSGTSIPAISAYLSIGNHETKQVARFETTDAQTKSDIAYFTKKAPHLNTVDAFLKDYRSLGIVLKAFSMSANIDQTAFIRKLMTEDPTSSKSVAQKLGNPTYFRFAKAMAQFSPPPFSTAANVSAVISSVGTTNYEAAEDAQSPGLGAALYFKRSIGGLTTLTQLMSDTTLLRVATTATNMPDQFGTLDYARQVQLLSKKIDMMKFRDPVYIDKFVGKYLAISAAENSAVSDPTGALSILTGGSSGNDILSSMLPKPTAGDSSTLSLFA